MDFHCIEMLLDLPELLVVGQVIRPHELQLNLERRNLSRLPSLSGVLLPD